MVREQGKELFYCLWLSFYFISNSGVFNIWWLPKGKKNGKRWGMLKECFSDRKNMVSRICEGGGNKIKERWRKESHEQEWNRITTGKQCRWKRKNRSRKEWSEVIEQNKYWREDVCVSPRVCIFGRETWKEGKERKSRGGEERAIWVDGQQSTKKYTNTEKKSKELLLNGVKKNKEREEKENKRIEKENRLRQVYRFSLSFSVSFCSWWTVSVEPFIPKREEVESNPRSKWCDLKSRRVIGGSDGEH